MWIDTSTRLASRTLLINKNHNRVKASPKVVGNNISKKKKKRIKQYVVDVLL